MNEQLKIIISAEIDKLKKSVDDAKQQVKSFKDQVKDASKNVDDNISKMGEGIKSGLKVVATTVAAAGAALLALGASTEEYRNNQAKLTTAFEDAGASASAAKDTYNDLYRVLGDGGQATEAAAHLAKLTNEEKALNEWTNICQGVYATFGDSLPIEGLTEAANETAKVGQVTGSLADALNWAGISEDEFNAKLEKCNSESEREKLIRETLNGVYDEASAKYEKNNKKVLEQREAQAKLQETTAKLGEAVAPVITAFTQFANDALAVVVPYIQELAEKYMPQLKELLSGVSDALQTSFEWASQHKELLAVIGGIILTVVAAITAYNVVAAVKAAMAAMEVTTVWALVSAYAAQAAAMLVALAPYIAVAAAIAAVIAIIVLCVKHWDEIKAKAVEVAKAIGEKIGAMKEKVVNYFTQLSNSIKEKVNAIKENAVNKFNEIKTSISEKVNAMKQAVVDKFNSIKSGIQEKISGAKQNVVDGFNNMKSAASEKISSMLSTINEKFNSIKNGIRDKINGARDAVKTAIDKIKGFFNFSWSLPKLKMPKISISGKFSLNPISVPKFSISWNKLGGVFDKPKLFDYGGSLQGIGEDGAEAVVPLEKNTKWLDRLATMLSEKQGGNRPIVLEVDGKAFAQISVDSINELTRLRGSLPLKFA